MIMFGKSDLHQQEYQYLQIHIWLGIQKVIIIEKRPVIVGGAVAHPAIRKHAPQPDPPLAPVSDAKNANFGYNQIVSDCKPAEPVTLSFCDTKSHK